MANDQESRPGKYRRLTKSQKEQINRDAMGPLFAEDRSLFSLFASYRNVVTKNRTLKSKEQVEHEEWKNQQLSGDIDEII